MNTNPYEKILGDRNPLKVIATTPARIVALTRGLTGHQLSKRPSPGKWSIHEIIRHLAEADMVMCSRSRWIAFEDKPTLVPFDQEKWARGWRREKESFEETLERFRMIRRSQVRLFRGARKQDLKRSGYHPERGTVTLQTQLETVAGHDVNHLQQIALLAAGVRAEGSRSKR